MSSKAVPASACNAGAYDVAFDVFTPALQERLGGLDKWRAGLQTSYWTDLIVTNVAGGDTTVAADTKLRTVQDAAFGRDGQTCSEWELRYGMVWDGGIWRIDRVSLRDDGPTAC